MTKMAEDVSKGNITGDELLITGKDEIADLSRSFNRMWRSVIKIVQILRKTQAKAKQ
ncbi:MAG: HAMP domain-containing protein [Gammaproteobacteria bacterium]|nr:HAMP domain-containing protein [Gammaproteobacteria bacterium]MBL6999893.1 HAMP domain-containing protein [Gammaproteobacteria bacterium]